MKKTIRIGLDSGPLAGWRARYTQQQLQSAGLASEFVSLGHTLPGVGDDAMARPAWEALLRGDIDIAAQFMEQLPARQQEGVAITAVSRRENPALCLLIRVESRAEGLLFRLKEKGVVSVATSLHQVQLQRFRPDLSFVPFGAGDDGGVAAFLQGGPADAALVPAAMITRAEIALPGVEAVPFNPRELVPAPGQGVLAWLACADDKATRRIFKALHHPEVSACTNVERSILRLSAEAGLMAPGAYCERDAAGYYHTWAFWPGKQEGQSRRLSRSQSTSHLLAEGMVKEAGER
ncbi:MAG: hypothetical protein KDC66_02685 [Phaeodactylibacter sp.]|nr:hypothetical protein [Phaeodactylibacter sp.]